jgi:hypothetical protein
MPRHWSVWSFLALFWVGTCLFSTAARAEFFGCNDRVSVCYDGDHAQANANYTHELTAQSTRPRVTIYPRKHRLSSNSVRQCRATLVKEYRISGTVIVPRTTCWWE